MSELNLYVLFSIREDCLLDQWSFRASDELSVARHLFRNVWDYEYVFWALRLTVEEVEQITAEELLQAIHDSYDNMPHVRAVLYLVRVTAPALCVSEESLQRNT
jgi:hypothetical protein